MSGHCIFFTKKKKKSYVSHLMETALFSTLIMFPKLVQYLIYRYFWDFAIAYHNVLEKEQDD